MASTPRPAPRATGPAAASPGRLLLRMLVGLGRIGSLPLAVGWPIVLLGWYTAYALWPHWVRESKVAKSQDFLVYFHAGADLVAGVSLYAPKEALPYTYPPLTALLLSPVAGLSEETAAGGMLWLNLLLAVGLCGFLLRRWGPGLIPLALCSAPMSRSMYLGQVNLVLFALVFVDIACFGPRPGPVDGRVGGRSGGRGGGRGGGRRAAWEGAATGLAAAIKVTPAFWAVAWFGERRIRPVLVAAGTALGLSLVMALIRPADSLDFWFHRLWDSSNVGGADYIDNQSLLGVIARFSHTATPGRGLWAVLVLAVLALVAVGLWRQGRAPRGTPEPALVSDAVSGGAPGAAPALPPTGVLMSSDSAALLSRLRLFTIAGLGALLISPVSWSHHWIWLLTGAVLLIAEGRELAGCALLGVLAAEPLHLDERLTDLWPALPDLAHQGAAMLFPVCALVLLVRYARPPRLTARATR